MNKSILIFLILTSCATANKNHIQAGIAEFKKGNVAEAKHHFYTCALERNAECMTKMALINMVSGDKVEGIAWFKTAAKFGDALAIKNLIALNEEVPPIEYPKVQTTVQSTQSLDDDLSVIQMMDYAVRDYNARQKSRTNCITHDLGGVYTTNCR